MSEEEKKAIVRAREHIIDPASNYLSNEEIETLLNLIDKQQNKIASKEKEIEQLANGIRVLGTNPDITTEEIIKEFTKKPITKEYMKKFKSSYISKDKIRDKIEQIDKKYYAILQGNDYINIVSAQHNSMKKVLEELLEEN